MPEINCDIDEIILFLCEKKFEGYKTVELIDDARAAGWVDLNGKPTITFIRNKSEPTVLGIDARTKK